MQEIYYRLKLRFSQVENYRWGTCFRLRFREFTASVVIQK